MLPHGNACRQRVNFSLRCFRTAQYWMVCCYGNETLIRNSKESMTAWFVFRSFMVRITPCQDSHVKRARKSFTPPVCIVGSAPVTIRRVHFVEIFSDNVSRIASCALIICARVQIMKVLHPLHSLRGRFVPRSQCLFLALFSPGSFFAWSLKCLWEKQPRKKPWERRRVGFMLLYVMVKR